MKKAKNFRKFTTSSGKIVLAGKDAEQNEKVISQAKPSEKVLHTEAPGSPFCNIKGKASKKDIREAALFCASYSRAWKQGKKDTYIHVFSGKNIYKTKDMKTGTFGVKKHKKLIAKKADIKKFIKKTRG